MGHRPIEYAKRTCTDYEERSYAAYAAFCGEIRRRVQNPPLEDFELLLLYIYGVDIRAAKYRAAGILWLRSPLLRKYPFHQDGRCFQNLLAPRLV